MSMYHIDLVDRWKKFSLYEQMANIGSEVGRAITWKKKQNELQSKNALYRALELLDFTIDDPKNTTSLKEIVRLREILVDYFIGENIYNSSDTCFDSYFYPFNLAARKS